MNSKKKNSNEYKFLPSTSNCFKGISDLKRDQSSFSYRITSNFSFPCAKISGIGLAHLH